MALLDGSCSTDDAVDEHGRGSGARGLWPVHEGQGSDMARRDEWSILLGAVVAAGWRLRRGNHGWRAYPSDPMLPAISVGGTTSDCRAYLNARAALRRAGLRV